MVRVPNATFVNMANVEVLYSLSTLSESQPKCIICGLVVPEGNSFDNVASVFIGSPFSSGHGIYNLYLSVEPWRNPPGMMRN